MFEQAGKILDEIVRIILPDMCCICKKVGWFYYKHCGSSYCEIHADEHDSYCIW